MPREIKNIPFEIKKEDIEEDGTFSGYGSISDKNPDSYSDLIQKGAFKETLLAGGRNKNGQIPMLWQHRSDQVPGIWLDLHEDNKGLKAEGKLALKTKLGNDIYQLMLIGAKFGLSIGYDAVETEDDKKNNIRIIKTLNLWELSLVTFPAKTSAFVTNIKSIEDAKNIREIEHALRESGHTKMEAQHIIEAVKKSLRESEIEEKRKKDEEESLRESEIVVVGSGILESLKEIRN